MQRIKITRLLTLAVVAVCAMLLPTAQGAGSARVMLFPRLHAGQKLIYLVQYRAEKKIKTESRVVSPLAPDGTQFDASGLLRVEILEVRPQGERSEIHGRARFESLNSGAWLKNPGQKEPDWTVERGDPKGRVIEFSIGSDGKLSKVTGLEAYSPDQQLAWQEWVEKFAISAAFDEHGYKLSQKWNSDELEKSPTPVAGLNWKKDWQYVRNEPCLPAAITVKGEVVPAAQTSEQCAVILSNAKLEQKSSAKNATPEDYKLRDLKTSGTATGANEVIAYVSLQTGLVVRATEEAHQFMDVMVTKLDSANSVHYNVEALSHSEIRLVTETPLPEP